MNIPSLDFFTKLLKGTPYCTVKSVRRTSIGLILNTCWNPKAPCCAIRFLCVSTRWITRVSWKFGPGHQAAYQIKTRTGGASRPHISVILHVCNRYHMCDTCNCASVCVLSHCGLEAKPPPLWPRPWCSRVDSLPIYCECTLQCLEA